MFPLTICAAFLTLEQAESGTRLISLDNGMRLLVHVQPGTPVFLLWAGAGAAREVKGKTELAQVLKRLQTQNLAAFGSAGGKAMRSRVTADRAITSVTLPAESAEL
jgi:predicted Zn-dependent peptidase